MQQRAQAVIEGHLRMNKFVLEWHVGAIWEKSLVGIQ